MLESRSVRPTANRIVITSVLAREGRPLGLAELEELLPTIDKSVIFRTMTLFREKHLVHVLEDSSEGVKYELCRSSHAEHDDDLHAHFYCESCHRTFCLEDVPVPAVKLPDGFEQKEVNFLSKGLCPDCSGKGR